MTRIGNPDRSHTARIPSGCDWRSASACLNREQPRCGATEVNGGPLLTAGDLRDAANLCPTAAEAI